MGDIRKGSTTEVQWRKCITIQEFLPHITVQYNASSYWYAMDKYITARMKERESKLLIHYG